MDYNFKMFFNLTFRDGERGRDNKLSITCHTTCAFWMKDVVMMDRNGVLGYPQTLKLEKEIILEL